MPTAVLLVPPYLQFFDANGIPLAGGSVTTYAAGTTTLKATYTDASGTTNAPNPLPLDSSGRVIIWGSGAYKLVTKDSTGTIVPFGTTDGIITFNTSSSSIDAILPDQTGNAGKALITNGANASWGFPTNQITAGFKDRVLNGLKIANNGTDNVDISAGSCVSDDGTTIMTLLTTYTKQTNVVWAAGSGNGGLDTGTVGNNTYHVWVINRPDTNVTDVLFSLSPSAPTLPTNYTKKKCIGSVVRVGGVVRTFTQTGNRFYWTVPTVDFTQAAAATTNYTAASSIPTGIIAIALMNGNATNNGDAVYVSPLVTTAANASLTAAPLATFGYAACNFDVMTDIASSFRINSLFATTVRVSTAGWIDPRI